jgi:hypothetical protein
MRPQHKWHKEIKAWADGAEIQWHSERTNTWEDETNPCWNTETAYRIKPQLKPDLVRYGMVLNDTNYIGTIYNKDFPSANFKVTFADDGNGEFILKSMEVL